MNRSKIVAILTGAISIILAIAYLILVQLLDYRDLKPAPISQFDQAPALAVKQRSEFAIVMSEVTQPLSA